jgi:hypothetical protein
MAISLVQFDAPRPPCEEIPVANFRTAELRPAHMSKHRPSRSKVEDRDQRFEKLLATTGMVDANPFTRASLIPALEEIERNYARLVAASAEPPVRDDIRRYRAQLAKLLTLSEKIGSDFFAAEIEKAGWSRRNPHADDSALNMLTAEYGSGRDEVVDVLTNRALDIDHWLSTTGDAATYRKRVMRKSIVEPFLRLMAEYEITTSPKQRPRTQIFDALFDWLGVEPRFRPTSANINTIAREQDNASG